MMEERSASLGFDFFAGQKRRGAWTRRAVDIIAMVNYELDTTQKQTHERVFYIFISTRVYYTHLFPMHILQGCENALPRLNT